MRTKIRQLTNADIGKEVTVKGWIKTFRESKSCAFIALNDGSTFASLQIVLDAEMPHYEQLIPALTTGVAIAATGTIVTSPGKEQSFELYADNIEIIGTCDANEYPLQKKHHSLEFLRTIAHLRPRTNTIGAVARVRNALAYATHIFFQERGFLYIMTPIITAADCEGAGQLFQVTTLDVNNPPRTPQQAVDYTKDFFSRPTYLTVSGQLNVEAYSCALSDVYTFGPTFRAEKSNTSRHLAEFWMIEPEMAFADLYDDMACAEEYIKFCLQYVLEHCPDDLAFFDKQFSKGLIARLENIIAQPFEQVSYTEATKILEKAPKKFEFPVSWGSDLQSEHERYLVEDYFKKPVIVYDYPEPMKAFYMRNNDDGKTVAAMDILVTGIGEIIGGSQREERYDVLRRKMETFGLSTQDYWWYLELRKYGSVPHAGFGLGFERFVQLATGMENIRDVIPYPRYPEHADF